MNITLGLKEHLLAYCSAWELRDVLETKGHRVEFLDCFQTLSQKIRNINELHAKDKFDLAVEIHMNSAAFPVANGTEVLYLSPRNKALAGRISYSLAHAIGTHDRGPVQRDDLGWLKRTKPPALIIETLFLSNPQDAAKIDNGFAARCAEAIAKEIKS